MEEMNEFKVEAPAKKRLPKTSVVGLIGSGVGILSGILSVIFSFVMFGQYNGYYTSSLSYGGDAYTGIQNAAARTANQVMHLGEIAKLGLGFLLMVLGLMAIGYFLVKAIGFFKK